MSSPVIELKGVVKTFGDLVACDNLNLSLNPGEYVGLLGPNGAGKTTLVEMIEGVQQPDKGEIRLFGKSWDTDKRHLQSRIGLSFQETRFFDKLTVKETVKLFCSLYGKDTHRLGEILDQVRLGEKQNTWTQDLSGGQRQRLALAIALLNEPEILLLDEPTTGLDPNSRRDIWEILQQIKPQGTTLILTTHYMEEAEALCDRILFMDHGKILADGSLSNLLKQAGLSEVIHFELDRPFEPSTLPSLLSELPFELQDRRLQGKVLVDSVTEVLPVFLGWVQSQGYELKELQSRKMTLDDLFVSMTGRGLEDND